VIAEQDENHISPNTHYEYDPAGHLSRVTRALAGAPGGAVATSYLHDRDGNLTSVTDPRGNVTTFQFDDFGHLLRQQSPVTGLTFYDYDANGNLTDLTDADGRAEKLAESFALDVLPNRRPELKRKIPRGDDQVSALLPAEHRNW